MGTQYWKELKEKLNSGVSIISGLVLGSWSLLEIEEICREKTLRLAFEELSREIRENPEEFKTLAAVISDGEEFNLAFEREGVASASLRLLSEVIRNEKEIARSFLTGENQAYYRFLQTLAPRVGVNDRVFLSRIAMAILLVCLKEGAFDRIINWYKSEQGAAPEIWSERIAKHDREIKGKIRRVLEANLLEAELIFKLLQTPIGPARGEVMRKIYDLVRDPEAQIFLGEATEVIRERARKAHEELKDRGLKI